MTRLPAAALALLTTTLLFSAAPALAQDDAEIIERGRALTEAFYAGELDEIVEAFDAQMRELLPDVATLDGVRDQILGAFGDEAEVLNEEVNSIPGHHRAYQRTVRFQNTPEDLMMVVWAFDEEDRISGFSVQPAGNEPTEADTPHLE